MRLRLAKSSEEQLIFEIVIDGCGIDVRMDVRLGAEAEADRLSAAEIAQIRQHISELRIPALPRKAPLGAGPGYRLELERWPLSAAFYWVRSVPPGWEPLQELALSLVALARTRITADALEL